MYFIEVLIGFCILSTLLLGLDATLIYSLAQSKSTYFASVAANELNNLIEETRAGNDSIASIETIKAWNNEIHTLLPSGRGILQIDFKNNQMISVFWGDEKTKLCRRNRIGRKGCLRYVIAT